MAYALSHELRFLTLLPQCLAFGFMEKLIQPCAMTYLGLWFPIQKINDRRSKVYFANGQFILMERSLYESIGGHKAVRAAFLEDFAMMEKAKKMGAPICCALGVNVYGTRMYDSFQSIWRGWRRIFLHAFCEQPWELCRKMLSVLFFSVLPFALLLPLTVEMWQRHNGFTLMWGITT
ncbi:MAG: hypothetical protein IIB69_10640, partial [Proteobacteria bacterium]|nr:hypothetical protein [Pseudomonadota bacterium]